MELTKDLYSCSHCLTLPGSPTKGFAASQATVEDLKHLNDILDKPLPELIIKESPNTPIFQKDRQASLDMAKLEQLLSNLIANRPEFSRSSVGTETA